MSCHSSTQSWEITGMSSQADSGETRLPMRDLGWQQTCAPTTWYYSPTLPLTALYISAKHSQIHRYDYDNWQDNDTTAVSSQAGIEHFVLHNVIITSTLVSTAVSSQAGIEHFVLHNVILTSTLVSTAVSSQAGIEHFVLHNVIITSTLVSTAVSSQAGIEHFVLHNVIITSTLECLSLPTCELKVQNSLLQYAELAATLLSVTNVHCSQWTSVTNYTQASDDRRRRCTAYNAMGLLW